MDICTECHGGGYDISYNQHINSVKIEGNGRITIVFTDVRYTFLKSDASEYVDNLADAVYAAITAMKTQVSLVHVTDVIAKFVLCDKVKDDVHDSTM